MTKLDVALAVTVFAAALCLRLIYIQQLQSTPLFDDPVMDEAYHDDWARAIAEGRQFVEGPYFRAPLYPFFLGLIYAVFGHGYVVPRVVQAAIGSLSCVLLFFIGRRVFGRKTGAAAGLSAATYWMLIYFDGELLIPTLIVFLDLILIWLLLCCVGRPTGGNFFLAGIVLGLSAIARPNILLFAPAMVLWIVVLHRKRLRRALGFCALVTAGCLLIVLPVTARNYFVGEDLVLIASQGGVNFYIGNNEQSDGRTAIVPGTPGGWWEGYYATIERAERAKGRSLKPSEVSDHYYREGFQFITDRPTQFFSLLWLKLRLFWSKWEMSNNKDIYFGVDHFTPILKVLPLGFALIGPLGLAGLALCMRHPGRLFPFWGFLLVYMVSVVLFFCTSRYRMPVVPVLILLAVYAVYETGRAVASADWKSLGAAVAGLLPGLALVHITPATKPFRNDAFAYVRLGVAQVREGNLAAAEEHYQKALQLAPFYFTARFNYGMLLRRAGRLDEAIEQLRAAVEGSNVRLTGETAGKMAEAHFQLGHALSEKKEYLESARHYQRAMELDPEIYPGKIQFNLGLMLERGGRMEESAAAFGEAIEPLKRQVEANPGDAQLLYAVGRSLFVQEQYAEALSYFERCLRVSPSHGQAQHYAEQSRVRIEDKP